MRNNKTDPSELFLLTTQILSKSDRYRYIMGNQPFLISFNNKKIWLYVKRLTPAYFKDRPDTTRAQLPKRNEFFAIKRYSDPILFMGYDKENDVFAVWNFHQVKKRLNQKNSVSFYSRTYYQSEVVDGTISVKKLYNGDHIALFKREDLNTFLNKFEEIFLTDTNSGNEIEDAINGNVTLGIEKDGEKIYQISDLKLIEKLIPLISANHTLEAMKTAEQYYNGKYKSMRPKDWLALIKTLQIREKNKAAELHEYKLNITERGFIEFMREHNLSDKTIQNYIVALNGFVLKSIKKYIYSDLNSMFEVADGFLLEKWAHSLKDIKEFNEIDFRGKKMYSCALKKYIKYIVEANR